MVPVTFGGSDWGLLAIDGTVETRATSARDRFNHWAALLLAVALDQERLLANLREQRRALEQAAARERSLADTVRASEERYALASIWPRTTARGTGTSRQAPCTTHRAGSRRWATTTTSSATRRGSGWNACTRPTETSCRRRSPRSWPVPARPLELEHRVRTSSGDYRWMLCRAVTVLDDAGCPARLVGALVDVTERKEQEIALQRDALRDPETGLVNRLLFLDRLGRRRAPDPTVTRLRLRARPRPGRRRSLDPDPGTARVGR